MQATTSKKVNGIDTDALRASIRTIAEDPSKGMTSWQVTTHWRGGTRSDTRVTGGCFGGRCVDKDFTIAIDEPHELMGTNQYANPQEHLMAAMNACILVGYVTACAMEGVELEDLRIETEGDIDLRGFLGLDPNVKPGYDTLRYTVYIKGKGTAEQFQRVHEKVTALSPNRYNVANPINLDSRMVVEQS